MSHYKSFREDGRTLHDRDPWPLPQGNEPGAWVEAEGDLVPCKNGLHVMRERDLPDWPGPVLFEVEIDGEAIEADDKVVCRKARLIRKVETWDHRTLVAWALDCAERVCPIFERTYPEDKRPRKAIEVTRAWLAGKAILEEVRHAADAAFVAYAAFASHSAAAYAAYSAVDYANAAHNAAVVAANTVAYDAAAFAAERAWQSERMMEYIRGEAKLLGSGFIGTESEGRN